MAVTSTDKMADEFEEIKNEIGKLLDRIELQVPSAITLKFHEALVAEGMAENRAGEYSTSLRHSIKTLSGFLESAQKELDVATHIAINAPIRAIRISRRTTARHLNM
jgi:microcystin degradation protein MlrC